MGNKSLQKYQPRGNGPTINSVLNTVVEKAILLPRQAKAIATGIEVEVTYNKVRLAEALWAELKERTKEGNL